MFGNRRKDRELDTIVAETWERATAAERRRCNEHVDQLRREHAAQCGQLARDVEKWQAGAKRVADQNRVLREDNDALRQQVQALGSRSTLIKLDGEYEALYGRLCRALRGCGRYRQDAATLSRLARSQQRQLDAATGMDDPGIAMGADWQARRPDTAPEAKLYAASPSGQLPRREPGLPGVDAR